MAVNISLKLISFGQIVFEIGKPAPPLQELLTMSSHQEIRYHEALETASRIYEVLYEQELGHYIVPLSTA